MTRHNATNERIKRRYYAYLRDAKHRSDASIDSAAASIDRFEEYTKWRDFRKFHIEAAIAFKRHLAEQDGPKTGEKLSLATQRGTIDALRNFILWLADQPGYQARIQYCDAAYFGLSTKDSRIAQANRPKAFPSLEQVHAVIDRLPSTTAIEKRDRALIAFTGLTACRDGALASLKVKHVDLAANHVFLDARQVKTKFSKTFVTNFVPIGGQAREIVAHWLHFLTKELLWGPDDPLFPKTRMKAVPGEGFKPVGLDRSHWSNASPIRRIFREAFTLAGLPSFNPHSLRDTLVQHGERVCRTPEEFKAFSQNLGHDHVMTTFKNYGKVSPERQSEIIQRLGNEPADDAELNQLALQLVKSARQRH